MICPVDTRQRDSFTSQTRYTYVQFVGFVVMSRFFRGGGSIIMPCMAVVVRPYTFASLQCRDGTGRVFTDQEDAACTKREELHRTQNRP